MLNEKIKRACREYLIDLNWVQAMVRAGYAFSTANSNGWKMFKDPDTAIYLKSLMDKHNEKYEITAEMVIEQMRRLAFADVANYYKWSEKKQKYVLKPLDELSPAQRAPIASYEPGVGYTFYSKDPSLDRLAKYFKLYSEIDQTITNFVLMPEMKLNGKVMEFDIGEPVKKKDKKIDPA